MARGPRFSIAVSGFVKKASEDIERVQKGVFVDMFKRIVVRSPVKTGLFVGNWQVGIGARPMGRKRKLDPGRQDTIAIGTAKIMKGKTGSDHRIYFANNLPYARRLEYGHSQQAPNGMVRRTAAEFQQIVKLKISGLHRETT